MSDPHGDRTFGPQGGIVPKGTVLDLSTCLNPYGPPSSVIERAGQIDRLLLHRHPNHATAAIEELYALEMGMPASSFVATRGTSEAIWQLGRIFEGRQVSLLQPTYTEYVKAFAKANLLPGNGPIHTVSQLEAAAETSDGVIFSNPHNPTGTFMARDEILAVASAHPRCVFIVDESYTTFVDPADNPTVTGCDLDNVVTLHSPTKFFGMGGVRIGVAWSQSSALLESLRQQRTTWPISMIDATLAEVAFADKDWRQPVRQKLSNDVAWFDNWLTQQPGTYVTAGPLHFRLVTGDVDPLRDRLRARGVAVRKLDAVHGVGVPSLRITAPSESKRELLG